MTNAYLFDYNLLLRYMPKADLFEQEKIFLVDHQSQNISVTQIFNPLPG
jgi:hypothetical protein